MTMIEAMALRHTVREYTPDPIDQALVEKLNDRIAQNNRAHGLNLTLVINNSEGLMGFAKLLMGKTVNNYIILAGADTPQLDEKLGYCGADLILYAQTLGLNTWWVGNLFSKKGAGKQLKTQGVRINGILAIGYGQNQGKAHASKAAEEISSYEGTAPKWFSDGIEALLLAPTAMNKQGFTVTGKGNTVAITCSNGKFSGVDLGIGKYHFELGAGKENFQWAE